MNLYQQFEKFENKFESLKELDNKWYKENCGVIANITKKKIISKNNELSEEWYRARMVWSLVELGYPPENICVEFSLPKGSEGAKSLNPDVIIFKDSTWIELYNKWDKKSTLPDALRRLMLIVMEAKNNSKNLENPIFKQMAEAMNSYIGEEIFGVYFDNEIDLLIFSKEGTHSINRYNISKRINGEGIEKLNLTNRDDINSLPTFEEFRERIYLTENLKKLNFETNQPITEDNFSDILKDFNRMQDSLNISHAQDLIVEFLMLKVTDEKMVLNGEKKYFEFYITEDESSGTKENIQNFRKRIQNLYENAKKYFSILVNSTEFRYSSTNSSSSLRPLRNDDEKFLIGVVKHTQKKIILSENKGSYNQIIFNNFGDNINKAKEKQFFTPLDIVDMIIRIINPTKNVSICDPCAGICDFLTVSHNFLSKKYEEHFSQLYAFDKDEKILKLAQLNLILNGAGNTRIENFNSINQKLLNNNSTEKVNFSDQLYDAVDWKNINDELLDVKQYDIVVTNPPFGKGRDLNTGKNNVWDIPQNTMNLYETWLRSGKPKTIDMGVIFLENAFKVLKPGGKMAIIISNSIAGILQWQSAREWLIENLRITAIIDLPQDTFGETAVATTVIIGYKPLENEKYLLEENYELYASVVENVGYSFSTTDRIVTFKPVYEIDPLTYERIRDNKGNDKKLSDLPNVVNEFGKWLDDHKHIYKEIYKAFDGNNYQYMED